MEEEELANSTVGWRVLHGFQLYYTPVLVSLGTLGNSLSVLVFFATKLRKLSSSYYLSALAVSDTGFLLGLFLSWLNLVDVTLFSQQGFCQLSVYFSQVCSFLSVWFIVAFTVERFIAVRYPLRRPSMCTVTRAKAVLLGLSLLALLIHSPYFVISAPQPKLKKNNETVLVCGLVPDWMGLASTLNHIDFVITLLVPFCVIVVLNTLISRTVWRVSRLRRSMTQLGKSAGYYHSGHSQQHQQSFRGGSSTSCATSSSSRRRQAAASATTSQTKVTQMLLVVSSVFICLNLPSYVLRVWIYLNSLVTEARELGGVIILQHYFNILFNTNFGINFALYCISGQNFRRSLLNLLCPEMRHRRNDTQVTVVSEYARSACKRTVTINGSWREAHEMVPINK